ncbi:MAG TPA: TIGR04086 family membrane protein [Symbiobacteriaceae bacterium]|nr:TIGR04086 family membrane protein [Symbiobacteriaceae bacterium]
MKEEYRPAVDLRAVGVGIIWGLGLLLGGALLQGIIASGSAMGEGTEAVLRWVLHGASALLGGFLAARRAAGTGWLHGALAGVALMLSIAAVMGSHSALPLLARLLVAAGVGTGVGALGGVVGVNTGGR